MYMYASAKFTELFTQNLAIITFAEYFHKTLSVNTKIKSLFEMMYDRNNS